MTTGTRNRTIDLLRLAAAFCIICLHNFSGSGVWGAEEIVAISRFAVPLFFLISGYFAAGFDLRRKCRQAVRIFILTVLSNLAYLALDLSSQQTEFLARLRLRELFTPDAWRNLLLFNMPPTSEHLWFLGALLYCLVLDLLLSGLFQKLKHRRAVLGVLSVALLLGGLVLYHVCTADPKMDYPLYAYRNFLFIGLPFFLGGKLIRGSAFAQKPLPGLAYLALVVCLSGLCILEFKLLGVWELYLGSILLAFLLIHLALCHPLANAGKPVAVLAWLGQYTSLTIYIVHIYVLDQLRGLYWAHLPWQYEPGVFHLIPIGVFLISLLAGVLVGLGKLGIRKMKLKFRKA